MKAPNDISALEANINYPIIGSYKYDGIRCLVKNGSILSSSLKPLRNKHLQTLLSEILKDKTNVYDGELYSPDLPFNQLVSIIMAEDKPLNKSIKFYVFDMMSLDYFNAKEKTDTNFYYENRINSYKLKFGENKYDSSYVAVPTFVLNNKEELIKFYDHALSLKHEGIMVRSPLSHYKNGRTTQKENVFYKQKALQTYDGKIIDILPLQANKKDAKRERDQFGKLKPVHSKFEKETINTLGALVVEVELSDNEVTTMNIGGWDGLTKELRQEIWNNKQDYIGKWVEFQGMAVGVKNKPRIPMNLRFRDNKD